MLLSENNNMNMNKNKSNDNDKNKNNIDSEEREDDSAAFMFKKVFFEGVFGVESAGIAAVAFMRFAHTQKNWEKKP